MRNRRDLFKLSILSTLGLLAASRGAGAQALKEHRSILRVRDAKGSKLDFLLLSNSVVYDVTKARVKRGDDLSGLKLAGYDAPTNGNYVLLATGPQLTLNISGGKLVNSGDLNNVVPNAWCEVGSK